MVNDGLIAFAFYLQTYYASTSKQFLYSLFAIYGIYIKIVLLVKKCEITKRGGIELIKTFTIMLMGIISLLGYAIIIYLVYLLIKALRIYIKKNS